MVKAPDRKGEAPPAPQRGEGETSKEAPLIPQRGEGTAAGETSATSQREVDGSFLLGWVVGSSIGLSLGLGVLFLAGIRSPVMLAAAGLTTGAWLGKVQGWALRGYFQVDQWMWVTIAGWSAGLLAGGLAAGLVSGGFTGQVLFAAMVGLALGAGQWFSLAKQVSRAGWWIWANPASLVIAWTSGSTVGDAVGTASSELGGILVSVALVGTIYSFITGLLLLALSKTMLYRGEN